MQKRYLLSFFLFLTINQLWSQIVGGSGNGESPTKEVSAASVDAGGLSGDVSLFTGTYNTSYSLGAVSTPSGLGFSLSLSYSSTFSAGDNMPHSSGIPYGEGWSLDLPMISVSTEDYNKYSIEEINRILDGVQGMDPTPIFLDEEGCEAGKEEGRLYYYAPKLSIPGYISERLVYKEKKGEDFVFVPHTFDRYVEARLRKDATWLVVLDDGTQYEMGERVFSHRNASNQRVQPYAFCNEPNAACLDNEVLANILLPKTEFSHWYCSRITHPNKTGEIFFNYEKHGNFDFFTTDTEWATHIFALGLKNCYSTSA